MGVDAWGFDEERQAVAHRLRSKRLRLGAVRTASFGVIAGILVFGGAAACRDLILSLGWPGWASVVTFLAVLFGVFAAAEVPFSYVGGFRWEHAIGLSTQTFAGWMKDLGKSLASASGRRSWSEACSFGSSRRRLGGGSSDGSLAPRSLRSSGSSRPSYSSRSSSDSGHSKMSACGTASWRSPLAPTCRCLVCSNCKRPRRRGDRMPR